MILRAYRICNPEYLGLFHTMRFMSHLDTIAVPHLNATQNCTNRTCVRLPHTVIHAVCSQPLLVTQDGQEEKVIMPLFITLEKEEEMQNVLGTPFECRKTLVWCICHTFRGVEETTINFSTTSECPKQPLKNSCHVYMTSC